MPPVGDERPLWLVLREEIPSVRALARELAGPGATDRQVESQRRKINKWLDEDKPTTPSAREAKRVAKILGKPADYFVRPRPARKSARVRELEAEVERLEAEIEEYRRRLQGGAVRGAGGSP